MNHNELTEQQQEDLRKAVDAERERLGDADEIIFYHNGQMISVVGNERKKDDQFLTILMNGKPVFQIAHNLIACRPGKTTKQLLEDYEYTILKGIIAHNKIKHKNQ
jgi:hypothetical protein